MAPKIRLDAAALATTTPILPHQQAAWNWLQEQLTEPQIVEFAEIFRADPPVKEPLRPPATNPLAGFPYFSQISSDGSDGVEGWRQCQTSAIAMLLKHKGIAAIKDDVDYLRIVNRFGDTTLQETHRKALDSLKVDYEYRETWGVEAVKEEIRKGNGVALGVVHHGPVSNPVGGGHWTVAYGYTTTGWKIMDPYGELNLVGGGWSRQGGSTGRAMDYSFKNFCPRWELVLSAGRYVYTPGHGWGWVIR